MFKIQNLLERCLNVEFCLSRCKGAWTTACTLHYRPWTGSIKPSRQHLQFYCFGLSLGVLLFFLYFVWCKINTLKQDSVLFLYFIYIFTTFFLLSHFRKFVCINDHMGNQMSDVEVARNGDVITKFFEEYFPEPSKFEINWFLLYYKLSMHKTKKIRSTR